MWGVGTLVVLVIALAALVQVASADGRYLIVVFGDGTAYRWPVTPDAWERQACSVAARNFTPEEWRRFVSGRSFSTVCPGR